MKYIGYRYGGHPVVEIGGKHYVVLSRHKSMQSVREADGRRDKCSKVIRDGVWYVRCNRLSGIGEEKLRRLHR